MLTINIQSFASLILCDSNALSADTVLTRDRRRGWGGTPYPPWGRSAKFTKLAKSRLFSKIFC